MATDSPSPVPAAPPVRPKRHRVLFRSPSIPESVALIVIEGAVLGAVLAPAPLTAVGLVEFVLGIFLAPALLAGVLTGPFARALGGRLELRRSLLLVVTTGAIALPIALLWRGVGVIDAAALPPVAAIVLFVQAPTIWMREMSLYGVSRPSHPRSLPPALLGPVLSMAALGVLLRPSVTLWIEGVVFLVIGLLACALLLRAADRPLKREFGISGSAMIRPLLDHIGEGDPSGTEALEGFFARFSSPQDLRVVALTFSSAGQVVATVALPTVHPGPFGRLGASDLPERLAAAIGPGAGAVFVPHTPCNHDQDLPSRREFDLVGSATRSLLEEIARSPAEPAVASPLVAGRPGSLARVQLIGGTALTVVTQAPAPTDDIDLAVVDPVVRRLEASGGPRMAVMDAHNSYVEDEGDLTYGTPKAAELARDIEASVAAARASSRPGPLRVGVAVRMGYSMGEDGIGPHGIRVLVIEAAGTRTAYVLIDGNNLVVGLRDRLVGTLEGIVDAAEVMTTDNHIVHQVDGGTNPVGERRSVADLARDIRALTEEALHRLAPVETRAGSRELPAIPVLRPGWTARLLTSLGDTLSMFTNALLMTFLLVVTASLVVLLAAR